MESRGDNESNKEILDSITKFLEEKDSLCISLAKENGMLKEQNAVLTADIELIKQRDIDLRNKMKEAGQKMKESFDKVNAENIELKRKLLENQEIATKVLKGNILLLETLNIEK